ncbi:MAG TPA: hypothetical protein DHW78_04685 [Ruminococcaceae bacterium]|jgi:transcriptional regulator with XRE-family HTH domain|nr:hypothetical protein [Oscillospiraceae bacterium]HCM23606.1 hypothetical protein [Oscillospiraceae bacterium]
MKKSSKGLLYLTVISFYKYKIFYNYIYSILQAGQNINSIFKSRQNTFSICLEEKLMKNLGETIGKRIRSYRVQAQLSQEALAERAGVHPTYIGQLERGEKNATIESIAKITAALQLPLSKLFAHLESSEEQQEDIPSVCYQMILQQPEKKQKAILKLLQDIVAVLENEE